jgi:hypothetical protein
MRGCAAALLIASLISSAPPVSAQSTNQPGTRVVLRLPKNELAGVPVWKNAKAMNEGMALIRSSAATEKPALLMPLLACYPDGRTEAVIVASEAMFTRTVHVVSGQWTGCRGIVPYEWVVVK